HAVRSTWLADQTGPGSRGAGHEPSAGIRPKAGFSRRRACAARSVLRRGRNRRPQNPATADTSHRRLRPRRNTDSPRVTDDERTTPDPTTTHTNRTTHETE